MLEAPRRYNLHIRPRRASQAMAYDGRPSRGPSVRPRCSLPCHQLVCINTRLVRRLSARRRPTDQGRCGSVCVAMNASPGCCRVRHDMLSPHQPATATAASTCHGLPWQPTNVVAAHTEAVWCLALKQHSTPCTVPTNISVINLVFQLLNGTVETGTLEIWVVL